MAAEIGLRGGPDENIQDESEEEHDSCSNQEEGEITHSVAQTKSDDKSEEGDSGNRTDGTECGPSCSNFTETRQQESPVESLINEFPESSSNEDGSDDEHFQSNLNKIYKPFRDQDTSEHMTYEHTRTIASASVSSSVSTMNPELIKLKVTRQEKKKRAKQTARRARKRGEAAVVTKQRRENTDNIKQSTSSDWF